MTKVPSAKALAKLFLANAAQSAVEREKLRIDMGAALSCAPHGLTTTTCWQAW